MSDPDEIWLTADCSKCHLTLPDARWKDPGPCTLNLGCEKDGTRYTRADLAEAREKALAEALGKAATDFDEIAEWANKSGLEGVVLHVRGYAEEARAVLAEHDKRKGGDDG